MHSQLYFFVRRFLSKDPSCVFGPSSIFVATLVWLSHITNFFIHPWLDLILTIIEHQSSINSKGNWKHIRCVNECWENSCHISKTSTVTGFFGTRMYETKKSIDLWQGSQLELWLAKKKMGLILMTKATFLNLKPYIFSRLHACLQK